MIKIAVDAMGGDYAPQSVIEGVEQARDKFSDLEFMLYGDPTAILKEVKNQERLTIIETTETIEMDEEPVRAIRRKKDSSLVRAAKAVKEGEADALFSCGNTGALLAAGLLIVGRIKGVARPGLISTLPVVSDQGSCFNLLDTGANAENKPEQLYQYGLLGKFYAQKVRGIQNPRIGLLNNGAEAHKGNKITLAAHQMLAEDESLNFIGNVEARDLMKGVCDVVVADGFTGNAVLKAIEGTASGILSLLKEAILAGGLKAKIGALLLKPAFKMLKKRMDQSTYGGAVLMGVKAPVVKAHGSSDAKTVYYTMEQIKTMVDGNVIPEFCDYFAKLKAEEENNLDNLKK
ncbi:phosphate acyltransferase PlsX [Ligilactobacillus ceti]|uniref:Phosphate acyltransferase n=1 Tax=Ligilactobacillus ceti DSM 22408 TaxID=1122146 RepID=A0A0R2KH51_9LACO|nr:phosphate acyltransferase PlsX [Ligilactobacillus ceti]KRN88603.1 Fatty acid phospholipid synthesis protein [Ligilactobacillus ceti DSM 22408]